MYSLWYILKPCRSEIFDWDEYNLDHIARHGVGPDEAEDAALDPDRVSFSARKIGRVGFIGMTEAGRVLVVILDQAGDLWRVVTARDASSNEKKSYRRRQR